MLDHVSGEVADRVLHDVIVRQIAPVEVSQLGDFLAVPSFRNVSIVGDLMQPDVELPGKMCFWQKGVASTVLVLPHCYENLIHLTHDLMFWLPML